MTRPLQRLRRIASAIAARATTARSWRALLALLILGVSCLALTPVDAADPGLGWDKMNHLLAFIALAFAAHRGHPASPRARLLWLGALLGFGGTIEILQQFVPGRSPEWGDLLADAIGIACGAAVASHLGRAARARSMPER